MKSILFQLFSLFLFVATVAAVPSPDPDTSNANLLETRKHHCHPSKCHEKIPSHSSHICVDNKCSFSCDGDYYLKGGKCHRYPACEAKKCKNAHPSDSHRICTSTHECSWNCNPGYKKEGSKCVKTGVILPSCKASLCKTPLPKHAHHICTSKHLCSYDCDGGFVASGGKCVSLKSDAHNCGSVGHSCPKDYLGHGTPYCKDGHCHLSCPKGTSDRSSHGGPAYCH